MTTMTSASVWCNRLLEHFQRFLDNLCPQQNPSGGDNCPACPSSWTSTEHRNYLRMCSGKKCSWIIPLGGNAFISNPPELDEEASQNFITDCGLANWNSEQNIFSVYFHSIRPGFMLLALRLRVPGPSTNRSTIRVTVGHASTISKRQEELPAPIIVDLELSGDAYHLASVGKIYLPMNGYMRMDLQGVSRSGPSFADVTHLLLVPESDFFAEQTCVKFVADPKNFYFGRRGPSVHLRYLVPEDKSVEYFYTELFVPQGQDVQGAYFCAAGFRGGYFGIQVNSTSERRILFSIWSDWNTDDPGEIPDEWKIELLKKGPGVITGEFGNEGAGGQSYLVYPWEAQKTYRFLVYGTKMDADNTIYTAWYNPSGLYLDWHLIASFRKPKDSTYLTGLYSFSENFIPQQGHKERRCIYGNHWVHSIDREWSEINSVEFTADATAREEQRMDISGGVDSQSGQFFLRNCGFFSDAVKPGEIFTKEPNGVPPQIDFEQLP